MFSCVISQISIRASLIDCVYNGQPPSIKIIELLLWRMAHNYHCINPKCKYDFLPKCIFDWLTSCPKMWACVLFEIGIYTQIKVDKFPNSSPKPFKTNKSVEKSYFQATTNKWHLSFFFYCGKSNKNRISNEILKINFEFQLWTWTQETWTVFFFLTCSRPKHVIKSRDVRKTAEFVVWNKNSKHASPFESTRN